MLSLFQFEMRSPNRNSDSAPLKSYSLPTSTQRLSVGLYISVAEPSAAITTFELPCKWIRFVDVDVDASCSSVMFCPEELYSTTILPLTPLASPPMENAADGPVTSM